MVDEEFTRSINIAEIRHLIKLRHGHDPLNPLVKPSGTIGRYAHPNIKNWKKHPELALDLDKLIKEKLIKIGGYDETES